MKSLTFHIHVSSDPLVTGKKAREREQKWLKMLENWDEWMSKKQPKVRGWENHSCGGWCKDDFAERFLLAKINLWFV